MMLAVLPTTSSGVTIDKVDQQTQTGMYRDTEF